jgi:hypothetical protein
VQANGEEPCTHTVSPWLTRKFSPLKNLDSPTLRQPFFISSVMMIGFFDAKIKKKRKKADRKRKIMRPFVRLFIRFYLSLQTDAAMTHRRPF